MRLRVEIEVKFESERLAELVYRSLLPEQVPIPTARSSAEVTRQGDTVKVTILAPDLTSARAAVNSWLRWLHALSQVLQVLSSLTSNR